MSVLAWNARGLGSPRATNKLRDLIRSTSPGLVFLLETKLGGVKATKLGESVGFNNCWVCNSEGRSGGLILLWSDDWSVRILDSCKWFIDVAVNSRTGFMWRLTSFYGDPVRANRKDSWDLLRRLKGCSDLPWCIGGDFNVVLHSHEKVGTDIIDFAGISDFNGAIKDCDLADLGCVGDNFTWVRGRGKNGILKERLDRFMGSPEWLSAFPFSQVFSCDFWGSDHRAIHLVLDTSCDKVTVTRRERKFFFEPYWLGDEGCLEVVKTVWNRNKCDGDNKKFAAKLQSLAGSLTRWRKDTFGKLPIKIKAISRSIELLGRDQAVMEDIEELKRLEIEQDRLYDLESYYWQQRSKTDWFRDGDRNTKFFHAKASAKRRKNRVASLEDEDGSWKSGEADLKRIVETYFHSLFTSSATEEAATQAVLRAMGRTLTAEDKVELERDFTLDDVKAALFEMSPNKSSGPDGFHPIFFQKCWDIVGHDLAGVCLAILNRGSPMDSLNESNIVLIPKLARPRKISDFRPISLCNVAYKVVTKCISNRLKGLLPRLVSDEQSAFVPGRLISDNTVVAFEAMHSLRQKTGGKVGVAALKLDMSKAYDKVEWNFLLAVIHHLGFSRRWVDLICGCLSTSKLKFVINGSATDSIRPSRGLRQGCPLSPFLFCVEGLSALFHTALETSRLQGFAPTFHEPRISHLFFADDSLVFCRASQEDCSERPVSSCPQGLAHDKYLGLPSLVGRNKRNTFSGIKERVEKILSGWGSRSFSSGGKEVLIKAVAQAMPTYAISVFRLPKTLCTELEALLCNYWWGDSPNKSKMHWMSWERLCLPKSQGGMGFRSLVEFNQAMVAKQAWRIIQFPDSLMARILKAKYFSSCPILNASAKANTSFVWRSILWGLEIIKSGSRWRIGSGTRVSCFEDPWIPRPFSFRPITRGVLGYLRVCDLIEKRHWNMALLREYFWEVDVDIIRRIPLGQGDHPDKIVWHFDDSGIYTVKSRYKLARGLTSLVSSSGPGRDYEWWKSLWKLKIPSKVKICVWRGVTEILSVRYNLQSRHVKCAVFCPRCKCEDETTIHALWSCETAKFTWKLTAIWQKIGSFSGPTFGALCLFSASRLTLDELEIFCVVVWSMWSAQNRVVFEDKRSPPSVILESANILLFNYRGYSSKTTGGGDATKETVQWIPPKPGEVKINVDAAFLPHSGRAGFGVVIRDHEERVVSYAFGPLQDTLNVVHAELLAIFEGLRCVESYEHTPFVVESDCTQAICFVNSKAFNSNFGTIVKDIVVLLSCLRGGFCNHVSRNGNTVAHALAQRGIRSDCRVVGDGSSLLTEFISVTC